MLLSNKEGEPDHTWHGGMMSIRFFFKLLIFSGFWASLTVVGFPLTSVAVASRLQASVEMRAIVHFFRGANFQRDKELNEAIDEYKEALKLDDQFAEAYNNRGASYKELGQLELAVNDYSEAILLDSENALAFRNRALVFALLGQRQNAQEDLNFAVELGFDSPSLKEDIEELIEELTRER